MFYDYIEIGTSDFETEINKNDNKSGISIEPVKYYFERLNTKKKCKKLNIAISDYNGNADVYYIPIENIIKYSFPDWIRGCNTINTIHPTVNSLCIEKKLNVFDVCLTYKVPVKTLHNILKEHDISGIYYLKIDTEGHDTTILKKFYNDIENNNQLPHKILFESNVLSNYEDVTNIIKLFEGKGYDLIKRDHDTILKLNLNKLKNKNHFTQELKSYNINGYPNNYDIYNLPHKNTFDGAKEYCIKNNYTGVTFINNRFEVRYSNYIEQSDCKNIISWILI